MEDQESALEDQGIAALRDVCDVLAEFHRELQQLRARQRLERDKTIETAEGIDNPTANATKRTDNGGSGRDGLGQ